MVGGAAGVGAFDFVGLEKILSRQVNSALKTLPILLGINDTTSETHGSIQWQIQVQGVAALQREIKRTIEKLANTSLQIKGLQAHAKVEYQKIRTVDRLFEAQADFFETRTIQLQEMMGWRAHDEASEVITGHAAFGPIIDTKTPAPNLSTNTGGDTTNNPNTGTNPKAGGEVPTAPASKEPGTWAAWKMLMEGEVGPTSEGVNEANARWMRLTAKHAQRAEYPPLSPDTANDLADAYARKARDIFAAAREECVRLLQEEGYDFTRGDEADPDQWFDVSARDLAKDVSDYVFGIGYSRQMKALLREAFEEGMRRGGVDFEDAEIDDRLIERVWRDNRQFILKIRNELREALRGHEFKSLEDVRTWFQARAWREDLMGRFLAKQGIAAGYAYGLSILEGRLTFVWTTSGLSDSCPTCISRSGQSFTYEELVSLGFPGSIELECGANCRCSLTPE